MFLIQLIIIQAITFTALVLALRKIMYSASYTETKRLQQLNQENATRARELAAKIEEAESQYQEKLRAAEMEAKKIKAQVKEESERLKEQVLSSAKQEAERIISQALNGKEKMREEIEAKMIEKSIEFSLRLNLAVLSRKNQKLLHEGLIADAVEGLANIRTGTITITTEKAELITPYPLDEKIKEKINSILCEKTGKKIYSEEKVSPEAVSGIIIRIGSLVIDGSLAGRLKESAEALKKEQF